MVEMTFRPMPDSPRFKKLGRCSVRPTHKKAMLSIRSELRAIGATDVIVEAGFRHDQIRDDGYPYSNARPTHPTIRISFRRMGKTPMAMTCGGYEEWHYNVYLIAKTLEALRAVDRYGCTQGGEQYKGWTQLPPAGGSPKPAAEAPEWASAEEAMRFLARTGGHSDVLNAHAYELIDLYRAASRNAHPDVGGSNVLMAKVNRARDFIETMNRIHNIVERATHAAT